MAPGLLGVQTNAGLNTRGFAFWVSIGFGILNCNFKWSFITLRVSPADVDRVLATYASSDLPDLGKCNNIFITSKSVATKILWHSSPTAIEIMHNCMIFT